MALQANLVKMIESQAAKMLEACNTTDLLCDELVKVKAVLAEEQVAAAALRARLQKPVVETITDALIEVLVDGPGGVDVPKVASAQHGLQISEWATSVAVSQADSGASEPEPSAAAAANNAVQTGAGVHRRTVKVQRQPLKRRLHRMEVGASSADRRASARLEAMKEADGRYLSTLPAGKSAAADAVAAPPTEVRAAAF